jgi:hypothetical protein
MSSENYKGATHEGRNPCFLTTFHHLLVTLEIGRDEDDFGTPHPINLFDELHDIRTSPLIINGRWIFDEE